MNEKTLIKMSYMQSSNSFCRQEHKKKYENLLISFPQSKGKIVKIMQIAATIQNSILLQVNTQKKFFFLLVPLLNEKLYIKEEKREKKKDFQNWINNFSVMYI